MPGDLFKVGYLVEDLGSALRDIGAWLDLSWTPIQESPLALATDGGREEVCLRYAYSTAGPVYLELIESQSKGYYAAPEGSHLHHVGRWVDDLGLASRELVAAGLALEAAGLDANGQTPTTFAFHRGEHGMRVELVDRGMQPSFEAWLAGGDLQLG